MLSISSQIDDLFSVLADPLIGMGIDILGFGMIYQVAGAGTLIVIIAVFIFINSIVSRNKHQDDSVKYFV